MIFLMVIVTTLSFPTLNNNYFFRVRNFRYKKKKRTPIASGIELGGRNNYFFFPDLLRPKFHMRENGNSHIVVGMMIQLFFFFFPTPEKMK